ncbi:MAG: hypothetical protein EOO47_05100 [Flavobacterium sp.]|nr:MAG: hypothetical protein EOO47_05100 [Flavobacterium sp.]
MVGITSIAVLSGVIKNIEKLTCISIVNKTKELLTSIFGKLSDIATEKIEDRVIISDLFPYFFG